MPQIHIYSRKDLILMNKKTAFSAADILLPNKQNMSDVWAVCACDQYTGEPAYWAETDRIAGEKPSALRLILPEVYLEDADVTDRIAATIFADGPAAEAISASLARYSDYIASQTLSRSIELKCAAEAPAGAAETEWEDATIRISVTKL